MRRCRRFWRTISRRSARFPRHAHHAWRSACAPSRYWASCAGLIREERLPGRVGIYQFCGTDKLQACLCLC